MAISNLLSIGGAGALPSTNKLTVGGTSPLAPLPKNSPLAGAKITLPSTQAQSPTQSINYWQAPKPTPSVAPTPRNSDAATAVTPQVGMQSTPVPAAITAPTPTDTTKPATPTTPTTPTVRGLFGTVAGSLAGMGAAPSPAYTQAMTGYQGAVQQLSDFEKNVAGMRKDIYSEPTSARIMQGREAAIQQANAQTRAALQGAINQQQAGLGYAQGQQQLQQQALQQAAGLAAPQLGQIGTQQYYDPLTGQAYGGGSQTLDTAVKNVVDKLTAGQMSYNDALTALQGYGQAGVNALQSSLPAGFNIAQSNVLAGTQGSIGPAYQYAQTAMNNLLSAVQGLPDIQKSNIPIINYITQGASNVFGVGSEGVQKYKAAIAEARSAVQKVLASIQGGTPTDYVGQSNALLPDNATPNQINAAMETLQTLGASKVGIYGNPALSGTTQNVTGDVFNW